MEWVDTIMKTNVFTCSNFYDIVLYMKTYMDLKQ